MYSEQRKSKSRCDSRAREGGSVLLNKLFRTRKVEDGFLRRKTIGQDGFDESRLNFHAFDPRFAGMRINSLCQKRHPALKVVLR